MFSITTSTFSRYISCHPQELAVPNDLNPRGRTYEGARRQAIRNESLLTICSGKTTLCRHMTITIRLGHRPVVIRALREMPRRKEPTLGLRRGAHGVEISSRATGAGDMAVGLRRVQLLCLSGYVYEVGENGKEGNWKKGEK